MIPEALYDFIGRHGEAISAQQMALRGVVIFVVGVIFVRLAGERVFGKWGALDIVLAVIIGSNLSRTITGSAPFGPTLLATGVLVALHTALAYAAVFWPRLGAWIKGHPTRLIHDGVVDHRALRWHGVGQGDLEQALRRAGADHPEDVRAAYLERNGEVSVIFRSKDEVRPSPDPL